MHPRLLLVMVLLMMVLLLVMVLLVMVLHCCCLPKPFCTLAAHTCRACLLLLQPVTRRSLAFALFKGTYVQPLPQDVLLGECGRG